MKHLAAITDCVADCHRVPASQRWLRLTILGAAAWLVACSTQLPASEPANRSAVMNPVAVPMVAPVVVIATATATATATAPVSAAVSKNEPRPVVPPAADNAPVAKPSLAAEQRRLAALFKGTPVMFAIQNDRSLRTDIPLYFSFDAGKSVVKPALAAVLDRLASSQRDTASRLHVIAPADRGVKSTVLAVERTTSMRNYLVARGVLDTRFTVAVSPLATGVAVVVSNTDTTSASR